MKAKSALTRVKAAKSRMDSFLAQQQPQFDVTFKSTLDLPAGHYFFVPKIGLEADAPAAADFLELSAPKPITPPGTTFTPDLQSWMRSSPGINPD